MKKEGRKLIWILLLLPLVGGWVSSSLAGDQRSVYSALVKPFFAPPGWVFGVVWSLLYLMLGLASWLVWRSLEKEGQRMRALTFYAVELLLNFLWTPFFFGMQAYRLALWELCAMLVLAVVMSAAFALQDRRTLWLTVPYVGWLVYAAALNRAIVTLNM